MKINLYAIPKNNQKCGIEKTYLTRDKCYKVWKILNHSDIRVVLVDDMGNLSDWGASLFTFKEIEE